MWCECITPRCVQSLVGFAPIRLLNRICCFGMFVFCLTYRSFPRKNNDESARAEPMISGRFSLWAKRKMYQFETDKKEKPFRPLSGVIFLRKEKSFRRKYCKLIMCRPGRRPHCKLYHQTIWLTMNTLSMMVRHSSQLNVHIFPPNLLKTISQFFFPAIFALVFYSYMRLFWYWNSMAMSGLTSLGSAHAGSSGIGEPVNLHPSDE